MSNIEPEQDITPEQLLQPGFVEDLVRSSRMPWLVKTDRELFCFIPPRGTQKGDDYEVVPGIGYTVYSPTGKLRGNASYVVLDDEAANELVSRRNAVLKELGESR